MRILILLLSLYMIISCSSDKKEQHIDDIKLEYLKKGKQVASQAQTKLLQNVSQAMQQGGPVYAIEFCNLRALPLKDSLSRANNCQIKRITSKHRNPVDMPQTDQERSQLRYYAEAHEKGQALEPAVYVFDDEIEYYQPIMLAKEACLKCHGTPGDQITDEVLVAITNRYPDDMATGYALNEFRGSWKITFARKK